MSLRHGLRSSTHVVVAGRRRNDAPAHHVRREVSRMEGIEPEENGGEGDWEDEGEEQEVP